MEAIKTISSIEFRKTLAQFTGTASYFTHLIANGMTMNLTDGCHFIREYAGEGAYWLFDIILSWQMNLGTFEFQVWKLKQQEDESWIIRCSDGNDKLLAEQLIAYSDFPIDSVEIWLIEGVALLPSEY